MPNFIGGMVVWGGVHRVLSKSVTHPPLSPAAQKPSVHFIPLLSNAPFTPSLLVNYPLSQRWDRHISSPLCSVRRREPPPGADSTRVYLEHPIIEPWRSSSTTVTVDVIRESAVAVQHPSPPNSSCPAHLWVTNHKSPTPLHVKWSHLGKCLTPSQVAPIPATTWNEAQSAVTARWRLLPLALTCPLVTPLAEVWQSPGAGV